jgi:hypothetical protein
MAAGQRAAGSLRQSVRVACRVSGGQAAALFGNNAVSPFAPRKGAFVRGANDDNARERLRRQNEQRGGRVSLILAKRTAARNVTPKFREFPLQAAKAVE